MRLRSRRLFPVLALQLAAAPALHAQAPRPTGIVRVSEVEPGTRVTAYTVFAGTKVEAFEGRILGVARSLLGPLRHAVLVEFDEERVRHTGIVHGMSGSPVYVGDRLLGAVALVLSPFPKDAIAGITPIEYMLADADDRPGGPPDERATRLAPPAAGDFAASRWAQLLAPRERPSPPSLPTFRTPGAELRPIGAPIVAAGAPPAVLARYASRLEALGLAPVQALGGGGSASRRLGAEDIQPGAPLSVVLVDGDLGINAAGTVTYRDGAKILAFGHPFLQLGASELPLAPAEVVTTLADHTYSYKLTNAGDAVGTLTTDRVTAIAGEIGPVPTMIPLSIRFTSEGSPLASYAFRVASSPWLTPVLAQIVVASSVKLRWDYEQKAGYRMRAKLSLAGERPLVVAETYSIAPDPRAATAFSLADDIGFLFAALYLNPFAPAALEAVELDYEILERPRIDRLEGVFLERARVRAGQSVELRVALRGLHEERRLETLSVPIPGAAAGKRLVLRVADSAALAADLAAGGPLFDRVTSLGQLLALLGELPRSDRLYAQLLSLEPDASVLHQRLPALPGSIAEVLAESGGPYRVQPRALLWQGEISVPGVAVGAQELLLEVRP